MIRWRKKKQFEMVYWGIVGVTCELWCNWCYKNISTVVSLETLCKLGKKFTDDGGWLGLKEFTNVSCLVVSIFS